MGDMYHYLACIWHIYYPSEPRSRWIKLRDVTFCLPVSLGFEPWAEALFAWESARDQPFDKSNVKNLDVPALNLRRAEPRAV